MELSRPRRRWKSLAVFTAFLLLPALPVRAADEATPREASLHDAPFQVSGRYPHMAMFNHSGECGTGAVVPWADRLWVITYAPHLPNGSDDKLYEISPDLSRVVRPESVGGTPADRLIHRESDQLVIGPYFIDRQRNVRVVTPKQMPGRLSAAARHLADPANKVYVYDMEGALFEVDVHSLAVHKLFDRAAPGAHGKGAYTAHGRLVVANNGNSIVNKAAPAANDPDYAKDPEAAGALAEWDGKAWNVVERRSFTDVTGPGGILGSPDDRSPLWAVGWDKRSVLLKLLDAGAWHTFRLPVADYSYVASHGWYTEWPRIREVASGKLLMNMHGQWFEFPKTFSAADTSGIRPVGDYLKITGDFCPWNVGGREQIVFGCDDASIMENPLLGQSQSNLWFTTWEGLSRCGQPAGFGGPWVNDRVKADEPSEPYLLAEYAQRMVHLTHSSAEPVTFTLETDADGRGQWSKYESVTVPPHGYGWHVIPADVRGQWVRVKTDKDCDNVTAYFHYGPGGGHEEKGGGDDANAFASLSFGDKTPACDGTLRPLGGDAGTLLFQAHTPAGDRPYVVGPDMKFRPFDGALPPEPKDKGAAKDYAVHLEEASVVLTQGKGRYRLPISSDDLKDAKAGDSFRTIREVVTERFLLNAGGSFYVLPRPTAGGAARIKPVCTHNRRISDFCSWRGLTVLAGTRADAKPDGHYFAADPGPASQSAVGLWFGDIDDLWRLGKPRGHGGPWLNTPVRAGEASDPFLMAGYDRKSMTLSHDAQQAVHVTIEVDFLGKGFFHPFRTFEVPAGKTLPFEFPAGFSAHWLRARCDADCRATVQLRYE